MVIKQYMCLVCGITLLMHASDKKKRTACVFSQSFFVQKPVILWIFKCVGCFVCLLHYDYIYFIPLRYDACL